MEEVTKELAGLRMQGVTMMGGAFVIVSFTHFTCGSDTATGAFDLD
jgi:hypothetical protein